MKKLFKGYALTWLALFAAFNAVCFLTPDTVSVGEVNYTKFGGAFWAGYIFITIAFIGQLVCAFRALNTDDATRVFYHIPIVRISYTGLVLTLIFGGACMAIPDLPNWIGGVLCLVIFLFTLLAVIKADTAADVIEGIDGKTGTKTAFIRELTAEAEGLASRTTTAEAKAACKKVYETLRYSDSVSSEALTDVESQIAGKFSEFSEAVSAGAENIGALADELAVLIGDRNRKCRTLK